MNSNGRRMIEEAVAQVPLIAPKQSIQLRHIMQDGPTAVPVVVGGLLPLEGGVQALASFGGFTKLEAAAVQIAGHMAAVAVTASTWDTEMIASSSADCAQAVLDECKRRQTEAKA